MAASTSSSTSPRKRHALDLFAGLPRRPGASPDRAADLYHRMGAVMSFGQDPRWRGALVRAIAPRPGERILDVATGTGLVAFALAKAADCQVTGLDQSEEMLAGARARLASHAELGSRVGFIPGEAEHLPFADRSFDAVSFTYLLRYVDDPAATMRELVRVLRPGGRIGMLEFGVPDNPLLRGMWRAHTRVGLPLLGRAASRDWYEVGRFLGPSIEGFWEEHPDLTDTWRSAGIEQVSERRMSFGAGVVMWGVRGGER